MTCGSCKRGKENRHGFFLCELRKGWEWFSPSCPCVFTPAKYEAKKA